MAKTQRQRNNERVADLAELLPLSAAELDAKLYGAASDALAGQEGGDIEEVRAGTIDRLIETANENLAQSNSEDAEAEASADGSWGDDLDSIASPSAHAEQKRRARQEARAQYRDRTHEVASPSGAKRLEQLNAGEHAPPEDVLKNSLEGDQERRGIRSRAGATEAPETGVDPDSISSPSAGNSEGER